MNRKKLFQGLAISIAVCLLVVITSVPSWSKGVVGATPTLSQLDSTQLATLNQRAAEHIQTAEQVMAQEILMAQSGMGTATTSPMMRYVLVMTGKQVLPSASTSAFGAAGAVMSGDRFIVRGDFSGLTSALRDYSTDPVTPPNPNITSGTHIHRGEPGKNGPFQYALTVDQGSNKTVGRFQGEYMLTEEQKQALASGNLYVDIHTKQNRTGELRGVFQPLKNT